MYRATLLIMAAVLVALTLAMAGFNGYRLERWCSDAR
jgi:hypothetical protein